MATGRLSDKGLDTEVEEQTTCCFAVQDKVWVSDPDGAPWEVYTVLADAPAETGIAGDGSCCVPEAVGSVPWPWVAARRARRPVAEQRSRSGRRTMRDTVLWRRLLAEFLGSAFLAAVVIGSGIAAQTPVSGRQHRARALRERSGHGDGSVRHHLDVRPDLGRTLQPGRLLRRRRVRGSQVEGRRRLPPLPSRRVHLWGDPGQCDVLEAAISISTKHRASGPHWLSEVVATIGLILVIFALARIGTLPPRPGGGRGLHRRGLLLHQLDQLRQPRHHGRPHVLQHLRRHCPVIRPELHLGPGRGRGAGFRTDQGAVPGDHQSRGGRRDRAAPAWRETTSRPADMRHRRKDDPCTS